MNLEVGVGFEVIKQSEILLRVTSRRAPLLLFFIYDWFTNENVTKRREGGKNDGRERKTELRIAQEDRKEEEDRKRGK